MLSIVYFLSFTIIIVEVFVDVSILLVVLNCSKAILPEMPHCPEHTRCGEISTFSIPVLDPAHYFIEGSHHS